MSSEWRPIISQSACTSCGECIQACPTDALRAHHGKAVLAYPDACTYCAVCEDICPVSAIELPFLICRAGDDDE